MRRFLFLTSHISPPRNDARSMSKQQHITHITDFGCETQRDFIAVEKVPDFSEGPAARMLGGTVGIFFKSRGLEVQLSFPLQ